MLADREVDKFLGREKQVNQEDKCALCFRGISIQTSSFFKLESNQFQAH
jgi:hypothetical protein